MPRKACYYASEHTGFKPNAERSKWSYSKYSSLDDKIDDLNYRTNFVIFGVGRATYVASHEIQQRHTTRIESVALVRHFDADLPTRYFPEIW